MTYTSFIITDDKKEKRYRVDYTFEQGNWSGGGSFCDLYKLDGALVMCKLNNKPVKVLKDLTDFILLVENQYGITPTLKT